MSLKSELWTLDNYHTFIFHVIIYWSPFDIRIIDLSLSSIPAEAVLAACVGDVNGPTAHSQLTARRAAIPGLRESEESCGAWECRIVPVSVIHHSDLSDIGIYTNCQSIVPNPFAQNLSGAAPSKSH